MSRYVPPKVGKNHSKARNSENSALFLVSCFMYILAAIVLSVGPPFRQSMGRNRMYPIKWLFPIVFELTCLLSTFRHCYCGRHTNFSIFACGPCARGAQSHGSDIHLKQFQDLRSGSSWRLVCMCF